MCCAVKSIDMNYAIEEYEKLERVGERDKHTHIHICSYQN